jgi:hypothetical protein
MIEVYAIQRMRRNDKDFHSILEAGPTHFHGVLQGLGAVIYPVEDVAMEINHIPHPG